MLRQWSRVTRYVSRDLLFPGHVSRDILCPGSVSRNLVGTVSGDMLCTIIKVLCYVTCSVLFPCHVAYCALGMCHVASPRELRVN